MVLTTDQYQGLAILNRWYDRYRKQFCEISGIVGTGVWELTQAFFEDEEIDKNEVAYLCFDQKQVHELAAKGFHTYYIYPTVYKYERFVTMDSLPGINAKSNAMEVTWTKRLRKKLPYEYKIIVVLDSVLMSEELVKAVGSFGLPVILLRDHLLLPSSDSLVYLKEPEIILRDVTERGAQNPLVYITRKILKGDKLTPGTFNSVNIIPKKQLSIYNFKSADMIITVSEEFRDEINQLYRERILGASDTKILPKEKVISDSNLWKEYLVNEDNKRVRVHFVKGLIGNLSKVNRHALSTKYINVDFTPEFYHEAFESLEANRYYLMGIDRESRQQDPDEEALFQFAYALSGTRARHSHWDRVSFVMEENIGLDEEVYRSLIYSSITRARKSLTIII